LAKPLSKQIQHEFSRFDATKQFLVSIGQTTHQITSRMTIWSSGYRVKNIKPLETEKALKDGAEFVGESFIFMVSFGLLLWEYNRSHQSDKAKQEKKRQQIKAEQALLKAKLHTLDIRLKAVEDAIKEQNDSLLGLSKGKYKQPPSHELVPIDDDNDDDNDDNDDDNKKDVEKGDTQVEPNHDTNASSSTTTIDDLQTSKPWWKVW
jgi:optic atrophy 3 protein